ncbi:ligase-associated DNA damage response endonuclease PdeM [Akkermansiaceae bacterium]|nr:ligase-associated DNA damage response endonuclease PdeM [Akkermansiaceae bacterium]
MLIESFAPVPLKLLPDSALLVLGERTHLVAADIHLGKSAAFRANGLPVPEGDTARDLARLAKLIRVHRPDQLVIAGDLFHAPAGANSSLMEELADFTQEIGIPFSLVTGNHDRRIRGLPTSIGTSDHLDLCGIRIVHSPEDAVHGMPTACGHIHPVLRIPDGRKTSLRLPCFHLSGNRLTLPAFGSFTGGHIVHPGKGDRFFVSHRDEVIEVPGSLITRAR